MSNKSRKRDNSTSKPRGWVKDKWAPCTNKSRAGKREPEKQPYTVSAAAVMANQGHSQAPRLAPTRGAGHKPRRPGRPRSLHRPHRIREGGDAHPGGGQAPGCISEATTNLLHSKTKSRATETRKEWPENTFIDKYAVQSIFACKENQLAETTVVLLKSNGRGLAKKTCPVKHKSRRPQARPQNSQDNGGVRPPITETDARVLGCPE